MAPTKTVKELQSFLGFCNFYRRFIKDYSQVAHSLFALTKKDVPYIWATPQESAFRSLIYAFTVAPVLALPNPALPSALSLMPVTLLLVLFSNT